MNRNAYEYWKRGCDKAIYGLSDAPMQSALELRVIGHFVFPWLSILCLI